MGLVLGPHARTDRTRDTRVAEPWLPAPEDGRPGEGQRLTPGAPRNGGRPPPQGTAPHHPRGTQPPQGMQGRGTVLRPHTHTPAPTARGWRTRTARPIGGHSGEGQRLTSDAPHTMVEGAPPGDTLPPPPKRATPARKGARCGAGEGPHARPDRTRDTRVAEPRLPAPEDGRPGEGQRLTPDAPRNDGKHPPRGHPSASPATSNAPTHQRTSHGTSALHPLLLGTATQHGGTRGPTQNTPPISDAGRDTRGHQGARTQRRRRRPPTRGRGHGLRPGGSTGAPRGRRARGTCAAGGQRAHTLPRVETGPLHRRRLVPQTAPSARPR